MDSGDPKDNNLDHVTGLIERVTFHSPESGFAVLRVPCSPKPMSKTIATGLSKSPVSGEMPFFIEGKGVSHDWTRISYNPSSREQN